MLSTVRGRAVVRAAALSAATAVSSRRVLPGDSLCASSLCHEHRHHHEQSAAAHLPTPMPTAVHGRSNLPNDRLPGWPAVPTPSLPNLQR
jgi:hypothetical protein